MDGSKFKRRYGIGLSGPLFETHLLSLLYFRAIHDVNIQDFRLASTVDNIGAFDDICFKATVKGHDKPVCLFIQTRYRENIQQPLKIDWSTYFISYLKIRQNFVPSKDLFFGCKFDETECYFVIYTTARDEFSNDPEVNSSLCSNLHDLIDTGGTVTQPYNLGVDAEFLREIAIKNDMVSLAEQIAKYVIGQEKFEMMLTTELMMRYHVILGQKVVDVSKIHPEGYRTATFRQDFFNTNDKYLTIFRDTLYEMIVQKRRVDPTDNTKSLLTEFLANTTDAEKLSKLIGPIITYYNGVQINKKYTEYVGPQQLNVSPETVKQALELAAKEILLSPKLDLKVPSAFGNKDLSVPCTKKRILRIKYLASVITDLLHNCKYSKIVTIDESLSDGILQLKGGIAGAIGNIFVLDENPNLMKVTDNSETLETNAKRLYTELNSAIKNLHEYKFHFKVMHKFPKLSLDSDYNVETLVKDFLSKLLIYSKQGHINVIAEILKHEIGEIQCNHPNSFQVETHTIYLRYYDEIQQWHMMTGASPYLTQSPNIFRLSIENVLKDPLMNSINFMYYKNKIQPYNYTFTEDAVRSLNLQDQRSSTIIVAENCVLTVVKVLQHLKNKPEQLVLLDLEYIASLSKDEFKALCKELNRYPCTYIKEVLILVCDGLIDIRIVKDIAKILHHDRTVIIITNQNSLEILRECFPQAEKLEDKKSNLIDMCEESQKIIFETASAEFPGVEIRLDHLLKGWPKTDLQ